MKLKSKSIDWKAGFPVVMLSKKIATIIGVQTREMVLIKTVSKHPRNATAIIDILGRAGNKNEIIVSSEVKQRLCLRKGQVVDVNIAPVPQSVNLIKKKLNNKRLSKEEIGLIVKDVVTDKLSEAEIALFVAAMYERGMDMKETVYLIDAILKSGNRLYLKKDLVVDKHCVGGVAGNRTTPLVVSICAAAGLTFPKTSSRAITSADGTADVMEAVARVDFTIQELRQILKKVNAFIVWGGAIGVVPADSKIIKVEKSLNVDPKAQLLASILAKKFAVGSKYILIDIPYGKTAKILTKRRAESLERKFKTLGKYFHKEIRVVLTDGRQPIGNGVGPCLELMDILKILDPAERGPEDLEKKACFLAGEILEMVGKAKRGHGSEMAERILYSGKALEKFKEIVAAQQGSLKRIRYAKFKKDIHAPRSGKITEINNKKINQLGRVAGSPVDKPAGLYLYFHVGDRVKKGEKLITLYAETKDRLRDAIKFYKRSQPIKFK